MQHLRWPLPVRPALPAPHVEKAGHGGARRPPRCSAVAVIRRAGTRGRPALDHSLVRCGVHRVWALSPRPWRQAELAYRVGVGRADPRRRDRSVDAGGRRRGHGRRSPGGCSCTGSDRPLSFLDYRLRRARARPRLVQHPRLTLTAAAGDQLLACLILVIDQAACRGL